MCGGLGQSEPVTERLNGTDGIHMRIGLLRFRMLSRGCELKNYSHRC